MRRRWCANKCRIGEGGKECFLKSSDKVLRRFSPNPYDCYHSRHYFHIFSMQPIMVKSKGKEATPIEKFETSQTNQNIESSSNESLNHVVDELVEAALASNQYSQGSQASSESLDEALTLSRNMTIKDIYEKEEINENKKQNQEHKRVDLNSTSSNDKATTYQRQTKSK